MANTGFKNKPEFQRIRMARKLRYGNPDAYICWNTSSYYGVYMYRGGEYQKCYYVADVLKRAEVPAEGHRVSVLKFFDDQEVVVMKIRPWKPETQSRDIYFFYPACNDSVLTSVYNWQKTRAQAMTFKEGMSLIDTIQANRNKGNHNQYVLVALV